MGARGPKPTPPAERVMQRVTVDADGCWIYTGYVNPHTGYGQIFNSKVAGQQRTMTCHQVMWESQNGPVPAGQELDHLCRKRACCNPSCLEAVDHLTNLRRGAGRGMDLWDGS